MAYPKWEQYSTGLQDPSKAYEVALAAGINLQNAFKDSMSKLGDIYTDYREAQVAKQIAQGYNPLNPNSINDAIEQALALNGAGLSADFINKMSIDNRRSYNQQLDKDQLLMHKLIGADAQRAMDAAHAKGDNAALAKAIDVANNSGLRSDTFTFRSMEDLRNNQANRASQYAAIDANRRAAKKEVEDRVLQDNKAGALRTFLEMGGNQNLDPQTKANLMQRVASRYSSDNKQYMDILSYLADNSSKFGTTDYGRYFDPNAPLTITTYDPNNVLAGTTTRQVVPISQSEILTQFVGNSAQQTREERLKNAELFEQQVNSILEPIQVQTTAQSIPNTPPEYDPSDPIRSGAAIVEWQKNRTKQNNSSSSKQQINPVYATVAQSLVDVNNNVAQTDYTPQGQRDLTRAIDNLTQAANTARAENNASKRAYLLNGIGSDVTPEIVEATTQYANAYSNKANEADLANMAAQYTTADGKPMSVSQLADLSPIGALEQIEKYLQNKPGERVFTDSDRKDILEALRTSMASTASPDMSVAQKAANKNLAIRNVIASTEQRSSINPIGFYAERDFSPSQYKKMSAYTKKGATDSKSPFTGFAQVNQDIGYSEQQVQTATAEVLKIYKTLYALKLREEDLAREGRSLSAGEQATIQELTKQLNQYSKLIQSYGQNIAQTIKQYK